MPHHDLLGLIEPSDNYLLLSRFREQIGPSNPFSKIFAREKPIELSLSFFMAN